MRIRTQCRECGLPFRATLSPQMSELACPGCGKARAVAPEGWSDGPAAGVDICPLCGCRHLYRQRDFNRALGCGLVVFGAILVPWTFGLSLIACSLIDLWLYRRLRDAVVCYKCDTVYRDAHAAPRQGEFDLLKHDVLKYGKAWEQTLTPGPSPDPSLPPSPGERKTTP